MKPFLKTLSLAVFISIFPLHAQEIVAPYAFSSSLELDLETLYKRQERFLKRRIKLNPENSGLDRAALASVYLGQSELQSDVLLIDRAEEEALKSLQQLSFYNIGAKLILAKVAEERHEFSSAIEQAKVILRESPGEASVLSMLVSANLGFGKHSEALLYADELVQLIPDMNSFTLRGLVKLAQGEEAPAMEDFGFALSAEKAGNKNASTFLRTVIGRHYYHKGDLLTADKYLDSALLIIPGDPLALSLKGQVARAKGNNREAKKFLKKAINTTAEPLYLVTLADILEREGNEKCAKKVLKDAEEAVRTEILNTRYDHYNELSEILLLRNKPQERSEAVEAAKLNVNQRQNADSYFILARAYINANNFAEADVAISKAIETQGPDCRYGVLKKKIDLHMAGERNPVVRDTNCSASRT